MRARDGNVAPGGVEATGTEVAFRARPADDAEDGKTITLRTTTERAPFPDHVVIRATNACTKRMRERQEASGDVSLNLAARAWDGADR